MKALLVIAQCDPDDIGESQWGYRIAAGMAQRADATLLTMAKPGREGVAARAIPQARVIEYREPPLRRFNERLAAVAKPTHYCFHHFARKTIVRLCREERFDIVHCCTPASPRYPAPVAVVPTGTAVLVGPYSGGLRTPPAFREEARQMPLLTRLRSLDAARFRHDPMLRAGFARADLTLAAAPYVQESLRDLPIRRTELFMPIGVGSLPELSDVRCGRSPDGPFRLLFIGRLIRTKGAIFAIRALAKLTDIGAVELDIIGDGDDRRACEKAASDLGPGAVVRFHGHLAHSDAMRFFHSADAFIFPSFREPAGNVVLEAMSYATPLVILDYGGPGALMPRSAGIAISLTTPEDVPAQLANAIRTLARDPELRRRMGAAGRTAIQEEFLWPKKLDRLGAYYDLAIDLHASRAVGV